MKTPIYKVWIIIKISNKNQKSLCNIQIMINGILFNFDF